MRRKEKEIKDPAIIQAVMKEATVCRLAMADDSGPYIVPLCFGRRNNTLYFHSAHKGRKIDLLRNNPRVCFEIDTAARVLEGESACDWGMRYRSIIGFGTAVFIEEPQQKRRALDIIMAQYAEGGFEFPDNKLAATAVFKVEIESMTGKQSGFS
jgi:hypothetical protein